MTERQFGPEPPLARLLLMASRWFDSRSLAELERRGWPRLTSAQSLLFAHMQQDGVPPAELARRLGTSRQATHDLVRGLVDLGLLVVEDDPRRRGGRLVCLTPRGLALAMDAYGILLELEHSLGEEAVSQLRQILGELRLEPGVAR
jgi:DNA-binding MarR family transcriptional regulator